MNIDSIKNGFVIDHIPAGKGMELYQLLGLDKLDCPVAMIMRASSGCMGQKDIIKIDGDIKINMDVIGYLTPGATINIIREGVLAEKKTIALPDVLTDVIVCKNPRCVTSTEQGLPNIFRLENREKKTYRCYYCEAKHTN